MEDMKKYIPGADMDKLKIGLIWAIGIILLFWIV